MADFPRTERLVAAWEQEQALCRGSGFPLTTEHFQWGVQSRWIHCRVADLDLTPEESAWARLEALPCDCCAQLAWVDRFASIDWRMRRRCSPCWSVQQRERSRQDSKAYRDRHRQEKTPQPCAHCGEAFTPKRSTAKFCSAKCRVYASRKSIFDPVIFTPDD
jgi:hypothetical protein